ncbi:hypothetical protein TYRP_017779 [Tyrophagus putrescentiae]|nr:hypothetical protein TYRP_017779 [Tyrophagus putrescentiae]
MSASKEDVPAAQAPKRRATLRRWITISHQALSAGVNPGKGHQPPITRQAVDSIGGELILHDIDNPDERVAEYVEKLREIKQFLDEQEEKQQRLRVDKEAALIEQAKAKTAAATRPTGNPMRLELKIPPFDGSPSKYRRFEELFESLIEESPSYTDAAKFLYFCELIGKLTDQYAPNLSPTLANLQVLKGRLRERFEDAGRVREHVRATFERLPTVRQSNQTNLLHQLIVAWEEGVLALQKTGTSDEQINNTYVRLMTHHLSSSVLDKCNYEDSWTALELLDALKRFHKRQLKLNEASSDSSSAPQREPKPRSHIHIAQPDPSRPRPVHHRASPLPNAGPERSPTLSECAICTGSHRTIYCNSFTVEKRRELVAKKKLCTRCLGNDHDQLDCRSSYVCRCGRPHSRVLCSQLAKNNSNSRPNSTNINLNAESDEDDTTSRTSPQQTIPKTFADTDSEEEEEIFTATTTTTANNNSSTQPTSSLKYARPDRLVSYYKTVVVNINGHKVRVLLDGGGGRSAITEACANRLNLPLYAEQDLGISGLGGKGKLNSTRLISAERVWEELRANGYVLTDTPDHHHEPIEIILGLEYIGYIWLSAEKLATEDICIRQSIFGWTAFGVTLTTKASTAPIRLMCSSFESKPKECTTAAELTPLEKQFLEEFVRSKVSQQNVMHKLLSEIINNEQQYPELSTVASLIKDRFYVDDLMLSFQQSTPEQIDAIQAATVAIFRRGSMNVRKWRTNVKELDEKWSPNAAAILKVLGHKWSVILDSISLFADLPPQIELSKLTKRLFSSLLARIYDPMGLITPYIVHLRLLLRKIWTQGLDWDEPVPNEIRAEVLSAVKDAHLPRNVIGDGSSPAKLVVFCDASKNALGAVAYAVVNNKPLLLFSKSRLVRLSAAKKDKEETIAELELDALVMSSEIVNYLSNLVSIRLGQDSTTKASPFAEVAISEIEALSKQQQVDSKSVLRGYKCFLDADGILRLRTRLLSGDNLSDDQVKPIILPQKCHLTELIIQFEHERLGHPGIDRTRFAIRDQFFVFGLRRRVITPAHFFSNRPLMQMPPIGTLMFRELDKPALVQQYKVFQSHINSVWKAWQSQYLLQLKSFHENLFLPNQSSSLRVGDAVILKNPTSPEQWPFGVVTEVIKSEDGAVRTVQVRTHDRGNLTIKTRDVRTLIPFECTQELHAEKDAAQSVETPTPDPQTETMFLSDR